MKERIELLKRNLLITIKEIERIVAENRIEDIFYELDYLKRLANELEHFLD